MRYALRSLLMIALSWLAMAPTLAALPESEVRAAIIVNFIHYVEWPDHHSGSEDTTICVSGRSATGDALLAYNGRSVHGRTVTVVSRRYASAGSECRILFVGDANARSSIDWLREISGQSVLTIGEGEDFLPNGGIVSLNRNENRVVFDINLASMRRANLRISSQLLRLARDVHGK